MKIVTTHWPKPFPQRNCDWEAIDDDTYDGPGCPIGFGSTEAEAIQDLKDQLEAREDDSAWLEFTEVLDDRHDHKS